MVSVGGEDGVIVRVSEGRFIWIHKSMLASVDSDHYELLVCRGGARFG